MRLSLETGLSVTLLPADCQLHFCAPGLSVTICASGLSVTLLCFWTVSYTFVSSFFFADFRFRLSGTRTHVVLAAGLQI